MVYPELAQYIQIQRQSGVSDAAIRQAVITAGWQYSDVDDTFRSLMASSASMPVQVPTMQQQPVYQQQYATVQQATTYNQAVQQGTMYNQPVQQSQMYQQTQNVGQSQNQQMVYAGFGVRFLASVIDTVVIVILDTVLRIIQLPSFLNMIAIFAYAIGMLYQYNATVGKMAMNLIVLRSGGSKLSLGRAALREIIGKFVSGVLLCIGYIMIAFSSKKQGLHDKIADTVVVYKVPGKSNKTGTVIALFLFIAPVLAISLFIFGMSKQEKGAMTFLGLSVSNLIGEEFSKSISFPKQNTNLNLTPVTEPEQNLPNHDNEESDRMSYYLDNPTVGVMTPESYWSIHEPELKKQLKKLYPDASIATGSIDLKPSNEFDFTGDNIPEVFVRLPGGGATTDRYGLFTQVDGKLQIMKMTDKDGKLSDAYIWAGAGGSGRYGSGFTVYGLGEMLGVSSYSQYGEPTDSCSEAIYTYNKDLSVFQYSAAGTDIASKKFCKKVNDVTL